MADSRIDLLRALALSSMPSVARRPMQRQISSLTNSTEERKSFVYSSPAKSEDKEEGELSSDDEVEGLSTPFSVVETSLSFAHRNAAPRLQSLSQGLVKEVKHTTAATSVGPVVQIEVPCASIFSPSTRVSTANKSQLSSAFSAQAPHLMISSQTPEPVQNGSVLRVIEKQLRQNLVQVTSSGGELYRAPDGSYHGVLRNSLETATTAASHATSTLPDLSLSQGSWNVSKSSQTPAITPAIGGSAGSPVPFPSQVPSSTFPNLECPVPSTVTRVISPLLVSVTACVGSEVSAAVGTLPAVSFSTTPVIGGVGVRKEAEAFLASLRIPLPSSSTASGDEKEDSFLIKFDEDSDSESENQANPALTHPSRSTQKGMTGGSIPGNTVVLPQSTPVIPSQSPSDLKAEIDRMKKQIAAMERIKGKTSTPSILAKSSKVLTTETARHIGPPGIESKAGTHLGTSSVRPASVDLESMRLRIAAKESELQLRRQRLAVKGTESGKGMNDLKGSGSVLPSSLPPSFRSSLTGDSSVVHPGHYTGKVSSDKAMSVLKKDAQARADGIPALTLVGPPGASLAGFKKDSDRRGLDGSNEQQSFKDCRPHLTTSEAGTNASELSGRQSLTKGLKRSRVDGEKRETLKVPRCDNVFVEKVVEGDIPSKETISPENILSRGGSTFLYSIQASNQPKRKADYPLTSSGKAVSGIPVSFISPAGSEACKKLRTDSRTKLADSAVDVSEPSLVNSKEHSHVEGHQAAQSLQPTTDVVQGSTLLGSEKTNSISPNSNRSPPFAPSATGSVKTISLATPDLVDGMVGICEVDPSTSLSQSLPIVTENFRSSITVKECPLDVSNSPNGIQCISVSEDQETLGVKQTAQGLGSTHGCPRTFGDSAFITSLAPAIPKVRHDERAAQITKVVFTDQQPKILGSSNLISTSTQHDAVQTSTAWRPVNPGSTHAPSTLEYRVGHSVQPGFSSIDDGQFDAEHDSFQHLLDEEELLDKELEEAQQIRQRCELRERVARREYRQSQARLRAANLDCDTLTQRKEFLLSRIHAAEARHYSVKSTLDRGLITIGGTLATHTRSKDERTQSLFSGPNPLPEGQVAEGLWGLDVNVSQGNSGQAHESPLSSNRIDIADVAYRDAQFGISTEVVEDDTSELPVKRFLIDDREQEATLQIAEVEHGGRTENDFVSGERRVQQSTSVELERKDGEIVVDFPSQSETKGLTSSSSDVNNVVEKSFSMNLENASLEPSNFAAVGENIAGSSRYARDIRTDELMESSPLEDSELVLRRGLFSSSTECTKLCMDLSSVHHNDSGVPSIRAEPTINTDNDIPQVYTRGDVPTALDARDTANCYFVKLTVTTSQDSQCVDSLRIVPDNPSLAQNQEGTDGHGPENLGDGYLLSNDTRKNDSSANAMSMNPGDHSHRRCLKDSTDITSLISTSYDACLLEVGCKALAASCDECVDQTILDKSSQIQAVVLLRKESEAVTVSINETGNAEEDPPELQDKAMSHDGSQCVMVLIGGAGDGVKGLNLKPLAEGIDGDFIATEPQQDFSHLPLGNAECDRGKDPTACVYPVSKVYQQPFSDVATGGPALLANSHICTGPSHPEEWEESQLLNKMCHEVSAEVPPSAGVPDDSILLDSEMLQTEEFQSAEEIPVVELSAGASKGNCVLVLEESTHLLRPHDDLEVNMPRESQKGVSAPQSEDDLSVKPYGEYSLGATQVCLNDTSIDFHQYRNPSSADMVPLSDRPSGTLQFTPTRNLSNCCGSQQLGHSLEEDQLDRSESPQQSNLTTSFDDNNASEHVSRGLESKNGDVVQGVAEVICRIIDSEIMIQPTEKLSRGDVSEQVHRLAIFGESKDQQQDSPNTDGSEPRELKCHDSGKKENVKGAEVEVFRKALLDGSAFERRPSNGEVADMTKSQRENREKVSEPILPQLQHHRLDHLLDMVEVRGPELSLVSDILVQEKLQGSKYMANPLVVDVVPLDSPTLRSPNLVSQSTEQALLSDLDEAEPLTSISVVNICDSSEHWVPSAVSLAVLSCIPQVVAQGPDTNSLCGKELMNDSRNLQTSFGPCIMPSTYESPLTVFRSYRICPQFSDSLHLSRKSSTWSHAINPFKPLCKFEHRGKCNNDDCPGQHADDYQLSSAELVSQIQNYPDLSGGNSSDHVISVENDKDVAMGSAGSSPTLDSAVTGTVTGGQLVGCAPTLTRSSSPQSSLPPEWNDGAAAVPIYCIGSYTLKADDPTCMTVPSYSFPLDSKVDSFHSFSLSPSIHRPLPSDMPCLLDASQSLPLLSETTGYGAEFPQWRYIGDNYDKMVFSKDGVGQDLIDEEMWLELALRHIDFDISSDNHKGRDQALFYLSRALESKPSSVALWVVYCCLFRTRKDNSEKDDMFYHAVQYNQGSYELWLLYINSRPDLPSRLGAYEKAIAALVNIEIMELDKEELSACILDLALQMLYCMCLSGCNEDLFLWVEDLIYDASAQDDLNPHRGSTMALLSHLTMHDACVLWIACAYFSACLQLPTSFVTRFGSKQELPYALEWEKHANADQVSHSRVIKVLSTAVSQGRGCLSLEFPRIDKDDKDHFSREVLGVNYVQCLAFYEGLDSAARLGKQLLNLYPKSLELVVICARINEHLKGPNAGLQVFEEAMLQWPSNFPGFQRLWNQYAGHALMWGRKDFTRCFLPHCAATTELNSGDQEKMLAWTLVKHQDTVSIPNCGESKGTNFEEQSNADSSDVREYFVALTSMQKRPHTGKVSNEQSLQVEDSVFALINLALIEALRGNMAASNSAMNRAVTVSMSYEDLRHCWKELASLEQAVHPTCSGWKDSKVLEQCMFSLLDRCKSDSHSLSHTRPLSQKVFKDFKKLHVCKFFEDLVGRPLVDHSILNSILHTLYGPQLLPFDSHALKEVFHFAEGILEAIPGNVLLALSLCKVVGQHSRTLKRMYMSTLMWASALLVSSLHQSCPVAPEAYWVEAGLLLRQFGEQRSLEEFYGHALMKYPFSASLQHGLKEVQIRLQMSNANPQVVKEQSLNLAVTEPIHIGVEG